jgi:hypothetical protein
MPLLRFSRLMSASTPSDGTPEQWHGLNGSDWCPQKNGFLSLPHRPCRCFGPPASNPVGDHFDLGAYSIGREDHRILESVVFPS